jgi:hypothetical protein
VRELRRSGAGDGLHSFMDACFAYDEELQKNGHMIKQGKPPATPGDSHRFDRYHGFGDAPKLDQELRRKTYESVQEFEPYTMGL